jgi:hypothetical protein
MVYKERLRVAPVGMPPNQGSIAILRSLDISEPPGDPRFDNPILSAEAVYKNSDERHGISWERSEREDGWKAVGTNQAVLNTEKYI